MPHIVLLGDSVFDNISYTQGAPDVVAQLNAALPAGWLASLSAVDGSTASDIERHLVSLPSDATHLVLSVGGNNALLVAEILDTPVTSTAEALRLLADVREQFEAEYSSAVDACLVLQLPLTVCTVYNGNFPDVDFNRRARIALAVFNDVIMQVALARRLDVIDLRAVCTTPADFANPIEPSAIGGEKIALAVTRGLAQQSTWQGMRVGACQGSCRLIHAANRFISSARDATATTASRSGLSVTAPIGVQLRVSRDQRAG